MPSGLSFSAAASALGYLYQVRYGLVLLLEAKNPASALSLEKIDDVAFEESGDPTQMLQFKHRLDRTATLTDSSTDLWKTLRVWATKIADGRDEGQRVYRLTLGGFLFIVYVTSAEQKSPAFITAFRLQTNGRLLLGVAEATPILRWWAKRLAAAGALTPK